MNHRPMNYRRSVYRRHRIRTVLIVVGISLLVLFLLFLWIGNLFSDKMEIPDDGQTPPPTEDSTPVLPASAVRKIQAPLLSLRSGNAAAHDALTLAATNGQTALSLPLTDANGTLLYRSEVAERLSMSMGTSSVEISSLCTAAEANGIYLCGSFTLKAAEEENPLDRSVYLSEAAAVIAEAFEYGVHDIVLRAPSMDRSNLSELIRLAEAVKSFSPNALLGLALPDDLVAAPDASVIEQLAYAMDYLALDLSRYGEEEPVSVAEFQTDAMLYYLLRYEMRVLVPSEHQDAIVTKITEFNIKNWMTLE